MTIPIRSTGFLATPVSLRWRMALLLIVPTMILSYHPLRKVQAAVDGDLDSTFGSGGMVKTDFSGNSDWINAIVMQPDGKAVVAGGTSNSARVSSFALARYNSDGSLDQSFGNAGRVITNQGGLTVATSLAVVEDGKILAGGIAHGNGQDFAMARYNEDGAVDASFGSNGVVVTDLGSADIAWNMTVQPDGKILLGGEVGRAGQASSFAVVRYKKNGGIDPSFGLGGKIAVQFSSGFDEAYAIALQADGKIVLAGAADLNGNSPFAIARLHSNGSLDFGFGNAGKVTTNFFGGRNQANTVAIQPDGRIVVAGWAGRKPDGREVLAIARYNSDGSLDATFGSLGVVTNDFSGRGGEARALQLQRDGKIVVAGLAGFLRGAQLQVDFATLRYNTDGSADSSYGNAGATITDFGDVIDEANAVAFQQDGKIVAAGSTGDDSSRSDFAIARYSDSVSFGLCISDEINGNLLLLNSITGDYTFTACASTFSLSGRGTVKVKACKTTLSDVGPDRNVSVVIKTCGNKANASIEALSAGKSFSIFDSNFRDSTCACR